MRRDLSTGVSGQGGVGCGLQAWIDEDGNTGVPRVAIVLRCVAVSLGGCSSVLTEALRLVQEHVAEDPDFAGALLREGIAAMLAGELDVGKDVLREYIKGSIGFERLGTEIGMQPKSLIRMFGPRGNPQARNLFTVIEYLLKHSGIELEIVSRARRSGSGKRRQPTSGRRDKPSPAKLPLRQAV
ncbi:MAG TPA: hypothetical protein VGG99_27545 [Acetobacteraceae bacterium]